MFTVAIVQYVNDKGGYTPISRVDGRDIAVAGADELARNTGKCYGVFDSLGSPIHETSGYYQALRLPLREAAP